jgi:hypothetical protein
LLYLDRPGDIYYVECKYSQKKSTCPGRQVNAAVVDNKFAECYNSTVNYIQAC